MAALQQPLQFVAHPRRLEGPRRDLHDRGVALLDLIADPLPEVVSCAKLTPVEPRLIAFTFERARERVDRLAHDTVVAAVAEKHLWPVDVARHHGEPLPMSGEDATFTAQSVGELP